MRLLNTLALVPFFIFASIRVSTAAPPYAQSWSVEFGTSAADYGTSVAQLPSGHYYVAGGTYGNFAAANAGFDDSFLQQVTAQGQIGWRVQTGSPQFERYEAVATAGGNIYFLTGMDRSAASGMPGIYRYDAAGTLQSTSVSGFPDFQPSVDTSSITTDALGNVYVVGPVTQNFQPTNAYVAKIGPNGATQWSQLTNTVPQNFEKIYAAVDNNGFVYVAQTVLIQNKGDVHLNKYTPQGQLLWAHDYGTSEYETLGDLSLDLAGNPIMVGTTQGNFGGSQAGGGDTFAAKVDPNGNVLWISQFGDAATQDGTCIAAAPNGHIFLGGVDWTVPDQINSVNQRGFWAELDATGMLMWQSKFAGAAQGQSVLDLLVDNGGDVVLVGQTQGGSFGQGYGAVDAFAVKFDVNAVPEPSIFWLFASGSALLLIALPRLKRVENS